MSYCKSIPAIPKPRRHWHEAYHEHHYGFPIHDDNELFGRFLMEINQAGLSWETILKKEEGFRKAYDNFDIQKVAAYGEKDRDRLRNDERIIRNKLKINAAIENAKTIQKLQKEYGSFEKWLETNHPLSKLEWVKLFKKHFKFTGGEITGEFLMSVGILHGAHDEDCPVQQKILQQNPLWKQG